MIAYIVMLCHGCRHAGIEVFSRTIAGIYQITCEQKSTVVEGQKTKFRLAYVYCQLQAKHEIEKMCYRDVVVHSH